MNCSVCSGCRGPARPPSAWRNILDLVALYIIGVIELFRQWLFAVPDAASPDRVVAETVASVNEANPVILLTGSTSGIGRHLLRILAQSDAHVIALTQSPRHSIPSSCEQINLDLSSYKSVASAANAVLDRLNQLATDQPVVLVNCAGVYYPGKRPKATPVSPATETINVNLLGPSLFAHLLGPTLSGIVWFGSSAHAIAPRVSTTQSNLHAAATPYAAYPLSKLLSVIFVESWSALNSKPAMVIHPGVVATGLYKGERGLLGICIRQLMPFCAWEAERSACRVLHLVCGASFWKNLQGFKQGTHKPQSWSEGSRTGVYWDAVSMSQARLPWQIRDKRVRAEIGESLRAVLDNFKP